MKKRFLAGAVLAACSLAFTAWYVSAVGVSRIPEAALPEAVRALLPEDARCERVLGCYDVTAESRGSPTGSITVSGSMANVYCYDGADNIIRDIQYDADVGTVSGYLDYQYDADGRQIAIVSHLQSLAETGSDIFMVRHTAYDAAGRVDSEEFRTQGGVSKSLYSYGEGGKTAQRIEVDEAGAEQRRVRLEYDGEGRVVREEDFGTERTITEYAYDRYGALAGHVQYWGGQERYAMRIDRVYDAAGRPLIEDAYQDGALRSRTVNRYDRAGRLQSKTGYDAAGVQMTQTVMEQIIRA